MLGTHGLRVHEVSPSTMHAAGTGSMGLKIHASAAGVAVHLTLAS